MDQLDKVEKIREKTGVSYQEAKDALEAANGDILDAVVYLENQGKIRKPEVQVFTTEEEKKSEEFKKAAEAAGEHKDDTFGGMMRKFIKWCEMLIRKGCDNRFIVTRHDREIIAAPVIILVILLLTGFWVMVLLLIVGMFFGYRYSFRGDITKSVNVNQACDMAADACENIRKEFTTKKEQ